LIFKNSLIAVFWFKPIQAVENYKTMQEIKAPHSLYGSQFMTKIFLAGSIEMGAAENWQERVKRLLADREHIMLFNPRRDDWDSSWVQSIENDKFVEQVTWELEAMERADIILMYFDPPTKSPISLLELGLWANNRGNHTSKLRVVCPKGFWRKGNVDIVCARYNVPQFKTIEDAIIDIS